MASPIYLGVIGVGGVGSAFLNQLARLPNAPQLILLARSTQTLLSPTPAYSPSIPATSDWQAAVSTPSLTKSGALSADEIASYLSAAPGRSILVDNTSDPALAASYPTFLRRGISIVTPNKKGFSSDLALWKDIFASAAQGNALVYHESTVGAGLPVISTLRDLVATGDEVTRIEGVFSGTLSFLFNTFAPSGASSSAKWSDVVSQAKELGYTEPDPRDDLNGMDVARKLTILARIAGLDVQAPDSFPIESLIPDELASLPSTGDGIAQFMTRLPEFDGQMAAIKEGAEKAGKVVRYVGSVDVGKKEVRVGLQQFDRDSAIAGLKGSDNIINFYTKRYGGNPLIVQGAGAGGDVTAMGVSADLIKVVQRLS
ncbi:homoserine dehydrogenase [Aspergillus melleus]|uniref:homoserine dehydrogenase n=1 Tax=Aspergillus melleus TaxID=138277 RepID=UPI001E8E7BF7|nr:Homoserine dehydrogenase [Aspergillus melleus]KAH8426937.1 Homoserine dehydrogenase [Aspergillus melleus]